MRILKSVGIKTKQQILNNWSFIRVLRLVIGGAALLSAINTSDVLAGTIGVFLMYQGIFNVGCCGTMQCDINQFPKNSKSFGETEKDINFGKLN